MDIDAAASSAATPAWSEATVVAADGTTLRSRHWPAAGEARAGALIVHGLGDHIGRYDRVAEPLAAAGIDVHGFDLRGFGGSAGQRAFVDRWSLFHDDLEERIDDLRSRYEHLPLVVYGHSMGGLIALGYVLGERARPLPDLLVLSSTGLDVDVPGWKRAMANALSGMLPGFRLSNGYPDHALSRDPAVEAAAETDPMYLGRTTVRLAAEGFAEQDRVRAALAREGRVPVPTYAFHGSDDPIVPVESSAPLRDAAGVTFRIHEGLRHECHHEPEHAEVLAQVVAWLDERLPESVASTEPERPAV
jgi:acylglycerol lipase